MREIRLSSSMRRGGPLFEWPLLTPRAPLKTSDPCFFYVEDTSVNYVIQQRMPGNCISREGVWRATGEQGKQPVMIK